MARKVLRNEPPEDWVDVTTFGSSKRQYVRGAQPDDGEHIRRELEACLGELDRLREEKVQLESVVLDSPALVARYDKVGKLAAALMERTKELFKQLDAIEKAEKLRQQAVARLDEAKRLGVEGICRKAIGDPEDDIDYELLDTLLPLAIEAGAEKKPICVGDLEVDWGSFAGWGDFLQGALYMVGAWMIVALVVWFVSWMTTW